MDLWQRTRHRLLERREETAERNDNLGRLDPRLRPNVPIEPQSIHIFGALNEVLERSLCHRFDASLQLSQSDEVIAEAVVQSNSEQLIND